MSIGVAIPGLRFRASGDEPHAQYLAFRPGPEQCHFVVVPSLMIQTNVKK